jgi:DNA replication and repair protein RecF
VILSELTLADFRNFAVAEIALGPGLVLIEGNNAQGKSNLLEAAFVFSALRPLRTRFMRDLIRFGAVAFRLLGKIGEAGRPYGVAGDGQTRRLFAGDTALPASRWAPRALRPVAFLPEDIELAAEAGEPRRRYLDALADTLAPGHARLLVEARRILAQRARALTMGGAGVWEEPLARVYAGIAAGRRAATAALQDILPGVTDDFGEGEKAEAIYRPTIPALAEPQGSTGASTMVLAALAEARPREGAAGLCLVGPHRDEVQFLLGGRDVRRFGSRGQKRTLALALRTAEIEIVRRQTGENPVLLVDDVLPELDGARQRRVIRSALAAPQALVACAERGPSLPPEIAGGGWYRIEGGRVLSAA